MNIEVGEYIRTKQGDIDKVILEYTGKCANPNCSAKHISCKLNYYDEKDIISHSKNIIDLIEVGDIVKVEGIEHVREVIEDDFFNGNIFNNDVRAIINDRNYSKQIKEYQIKSIVTKEQFSNMEYRL